MRLSRRAGVVPAMSVVLLAGVFVTAGCATQEAAGPDTNVVVEDQGVAQPTEVESVVAQPTVVETVVAQPTEAEAVNAGESTSGEEAAPAALLTFVIVPEQSDASYTADEEFFSGAVERLGKALGLAEPVGVAQGLEGSIDLSLSGAPQVMGGELTIDLRGLTSDDERRDNKIREDWLASDQFPDARFEITGAEGLPATYTNGEEITFTLLGDLTVHDVTQPVSWEVTAVVNGDTLTGTAITTIRFSDFGMQAPNMANMFVVQDELTLEANIVAQAAPTE